MKQLMLILILGMFSNLLMGQTAYIETLKSEVSNLEKRLKTLTSKNAQAIEIRNTTVKLEERKERLEKAIKVEEERQAYQGIMFHFLDKQYKQLEKEVGSADVYEEFDSLHCRKLYRFTGYAFFDDDDLYLFADSLNIYHDTTIRQNFYRLPNQFAVALANKNLLFNGHIYLSESETMKRNDYSRLNEKAMLEKKLDKFDTFNEINKSSDNAPLEEKAKAYFTQKYEPVKVTVSGILRAKKSYLSGRFLELEKWVIQE